MTGRNIELSTQYLCFVDHFDRVLLEKIVLLLSVSPNFILVGRRNREGGLESLQRMLLLFLIYINDLPKCLNAGSKPDMFADDTQIATASHDIEVITETLNSDLNNVASWLSANKLTLNNSKTEYMIIGSKKRLGLVTCDPIINVGNLKINRVEATKSLGLMIDESLNWSAHVDHIFKKVALGLAILRKVREILDFDTLIIIYQSIIQPFFDYCAQVWGCLGKTVVKVQKLQNRAFRIITRENYTTRSADILKLILPKPKTNSMKNAFSYRGAEAWNTLSPSQKSSKSLANFKANLKY